MKAQKVFVLIEGGYEDGQVEIIGVFSSHEKANAEKRKQQSKLDDELDDWIWYDIQEREIQ
ncbi:MAG: hypothetical protein IKZ25_04915 [Clostridia bacterium]|nr:hypothetical protein [Clostridia bacterium]